MGSFFSGLFGGSSNEGLKDFSAVHTDMHSHLIPGIDDGSKSLEESLALITELYHLGFRKLITTPHIMYDFYKNTPEIILDGLEQVRVAVKNAGIPVILEAAAEYYIDDGFLLKMEKEKLLTFGNNHLLIEVSFLNVPGNFREVIFKIQTAGYRPILAHAERYPFWQNKMDEFQRLKDSGVLLQLNINSLTGYYSPGAKKTAEKMIAAKMFDLIGTDTHGARHTSLLKKCLKEKYCRKIIESGKLLNSTL